MTRQHWIGYAALLALSTALPAVAAPEQANTLLSAAAADDTAFALVRSLTTEIGPRLAGTPADDAARRWAVERLKAMGFANVREEPFTMKGWVRGEERADIVSPAPQPLHIVGFGRSVPTPPAGITADVVRIASLDMLRESGSLGGRIVFFDGPKLVSGRAGPEEGGPGPRTVAAEAAGKGAAALIMRSGGTGGHRFAHVRVINYARTTRPIPVAGIADPDADQLRRLLETGHPVRVRLLLQSHDPGIIRSANVIGEIPGSVTPEEIVLLGAHLDSWDLGTGAVDDGAGVAIVTAAARLIGQLPGKPKRTIRVVLFGAEEVSLDGARAYADRHAAELHRHYLALEADFGAAPVWGFYTNVPEPMLPVMDRIADALSFLGIERGHNHASGGEDLTFIRQAGVPVVTLIQDGTHYFDYHHSADDTFDKIDPKALRQNVAAFALTAHLAAEM